MKSLASITSLLFVAVVFSVDNVEAQSSFVEHNYRAFGNVQLAIDADYPDQDAGIGPDGRHVPDASNCITVRVPKGKKLIVRITCDPDSWYENAVQVHDSNWGKQMEAGNHSRKKQLVKEFSQSATDTFHTVSFWTKGHPPKGDLPWCRAPQKRITTFNGDTVIQFDDSSSKPIAFNDMKVIISVR